MSSDEFPSILRNAAAIVRAKLSGMDGVEKFLSNLESRAPRQAADPKVHRELFIEPWIDAQQVGVPVETAEAVAELLQRFGVLRLWVRVHCPDADESEPATILETDNAEDFDQLVSKSCGHCGRHHDLRWEHCETVFAFNVAGSDADRSSTTAAFGQRYFAAQAAIRNGGVTSFGVRRPRMRF